ncbi:MAG: membrane protein insertase YidC [Candidatus Hydrogenedens sp.]|jgi:YidC/Oxa1 family membrane protein insertase|nr:membrane protein insertase YidC [Candidatus Hydrogenedens sp.]
MHFLSTIIIATLLLFVQVTGSYGIAIILFAVLLKLLLLPLTLYGMKWQEKFQASFQTAKDQIANLETSDAAKRDDEILNIYQNHGINFTNQCKALLPLLIQLPLLVAFYKTMIGWEILAEQSFLWINNLREVDRIMSLGFSLPWLGDSLNLLPFTLFFVNASEVIFFRDETTSIKSFSLPVIFLFLFYPFPSSCMIFWITLNVVHVPERWYYVRFRSSSASSASSASSTSGS